MQPATLGQMAVSRAGTARTSTRAMASKMTKPTATTTFDSVRRSEGAPTRVVATGHGQGVFVLPFSTASDDQCPGMRLKWGRPVVGPVLAPSRRRGLGVKGRPRPSDRQGAALDAGVAVQPRSWALAGSTTD
jgi:hypothetical protein